MKILNITEISNKRKLCCNLTNISGSGLHLACRPQCTDPNFSELPVLLLSSFDLSSCLAETYERPNKFSSCPLLLQLKLRDFASTDENIPDSPCTKEPCRKFLYLSQIHNNFFFFPYLYQKVVFSFLHMLAQFYSEFHSYIYEKLILPSLSLSSSLQTPPAP